MARISEDFARLESGYLFPEVARRIRRWQERNPGADVMRLSIGNTTEPITPHIAEAMKKRICMLSDRRTYTGYGDEQGDTALREALMEHYRKEYDHSSPIQRFDELDGVRDKVVLL